ncbi:molybdopterin-dependent oxidoreductase-like protein [Tamaricihabitans halophyticus]|uniref:Molybdopterin-dependent oxidoreductase-like protein n=1 Tax=Tamaricihabitans halophyticus TaxID=1262583 RepID=A0A4R2QCN2_9PSEU|nr:molybdopterin-dependent oxidoreductase [Tamaricihabitans halophyticus]TCP46780.1 molybdopterin-dependent oxidoreductase-like protein [Tamaricihabitans halophyticus]
MADTHPNRLPRGQAPAALLRFGLPWFAGVRPVVPERPHVWAGGVVRRPSQFDLAELLALPRQHARRADLHCVTTWSATDLSWSGVSFRAVHELLAERVQPHPGCRWVRFTGLDGYRSCLALDDALADDVLLADALNGQQLTVDEGAPARLVAPAHYGYKSVRHVCAIEYLRAYDSGSARWLGHPRARVAREERSRFLPGRAWRPIWRALLPRVRARYARSHG